MRRTCSSEVCAPRCEVSSRIKGEGERAMDKSRLVNKLILNRGKWVEQQEEKKEAGDMSYVVVCRGKWCNKLRQML